MLKAPATKMREQLSEDVRALPRGNQNFWQMLLPTDTADRKVGQARELLWLCKVKPMFCPNAELQSQAGDFGLAKILKPSQGLCFLHAQVACCPAPFLAQRMDVLSYLCYCI